MYIGSDDSIVYKFDETDNGLEHTTELITNGSCEADANYTSYGTPTTHERSSSQAHNGTYSRRAVTDAVNEGFYQDVTTVVGQNYRVTCMIYVASGDARVSQSRSRTSRSCRSSCKVKCFFSPR